MSRFPASFDRAVYRERMRLSIEPFLLDADKRGAETPSGAYVQVVGLGVGAWALQGRMQTDLMYGGHAGLFQRLRYQP